MKLSIGRPIGRHLARPLVLVFTALCGFQALAWDRKPEHLPPQATAEASAAASASASQWQIASQAQSQQQGQQQTQANTQNVAHTLHQMIESEPQVPSTFTSNASPSAPCYVVNTWSVGVPYAGGGRGKSKRDEECWAEFVKQAEHQRRMDLAKLELERDRIKLESLRLTQCTTCEQQK